MTVYSYTIVICTRETTSGSGERKMRLEDAWRDIGVTNRWMDFRSNFPPFFTLPSQFLKF